MSKVGLLVLASLILTGAMGFAQGNIGCPCYIGDSFDSLDPAGSLILARPGGESENVIEASQPAFVRHGWQMDAGCGGVSAEEMCSFARDHLKFKLEVNGQFIEPSFITIWEYPAPVGCPSLPERSVWGAVWTFEFGADHFAPGVHFLRGYWSVEDFPYACLACDILQVDEALMEDCRACGITLIEGLMPEGLEYGEDVYSQSHMRSSELTVLWPTHP